MNRSPSPRSHHVWAMTSIFSVVAMLCTLLALFPAPPSSASAPPEPDDDPPARSKIHDKLLKRFQKEGGKPQDFWVRFESSPDLDAAYDIDEWVERGQHVVDELQAEAARQQQGTIRTLKARGVEFEAFWVSNAILVEDGSRALAERLAARSEVAQVLAPTIYEIPEPVVTEVDEATYGPNAAVEWGIANIGANQVWADGIDGNGIVVANIDTGVQFDHPALVDAYRGNNHDGTFTHDYNWFDGSNHCASDAPCDTNGHGTHTIGTMAGGDGPAGGIGVAPEATWIAGNGCEPCTQQNLLASAQWMLQPTRVDGSDPDVSKRPHIVNNSWGSQAPSLDPWFDDLSGAWAASGIFGVWANGNNGPQCQTRGAPGSRTINYAVGAYDVANTIATFSSRGSGQDGVIKPDISAPGVSVRSAYLNGQFARASGTSMAAPHVSGAIALLWSATPELVGDLQTTRDLLDATAVDTPDDQCDGEAANNNVYGEGRLDAVSLLANREVGTVSGTVTADSGAPIPDATLTLTGGAAEHPVTRTATTDSDGTYRLNVPAGTYQVQAAPYGYLAEQASVSVAADTVSVQDFQLTAAPMATVSGRISDGSGHGWPVYSALTFPGYPDNPVYTDPVTGEFTLQLPSASDYEVTIDPVYDGYPTTQRQLSVGDSDHRFDEAVTIDAEACVAPGYGWNGLSTSFTEWRDTTPRDEWQATRKGKGGTWQFDNPRHRPQPAADNEFAIADTGIDGSSALTTTLTSPPVNLSGQSDPQLAFDTRYLGAARQQAVVEVSTDGATWHPVWSAGTDSAYFRQTIPLAGAANSPEVRVRFTFTGRAGGGYWAIDDVLIGTDECVPHAGGLLVGQVADQAGQPLPGTRIRLEDHSEATTVSRRFPDDTALQGAALYWLFSRAGTGRVTAEKAGYQPSTTEVAITTDQLVRHDLRLQSDV